MVNPAPHPATGRLLFVGNDFARKGGPQLADLFHRALLPECTLTVVSNDPAARAVPHGVEVISGIHDPTALADVYRRSDLLVLPTHFDWYSHVICEAASHGIPAVATRVGAIGELLDEAGGTSLPRSPSADDIAVTIRAALDSGYMARARKAALFATERLTMSTFAGAVGNAVSRL